MDFCVSRFRQHWPFCYFIPLLIVLLIVHNFLYIFCSNRHHTIQTTWASCWRTDGEDMASTTQQNLDRKGSPPVTNKQNHYNQTNEIINESASINEDKPVETRWNSQVCDHCREELSQSSSQNKPLNIPTEEELSLCHRCIKTLPPGLKTEDHLPELDSSNLHLPESPSTEIGGVGTEKDHYNGQSWRGTESPFTLIEVKEEFCEEALKYENPNTKEQNHQHKTYNIQKSNL